jgi:hypothetical protein
MPVNLAEITLTSDPATCTHEPEWILEVETRRVYQLPCRFCRANAG